MEYKGYDINFGLTDKVAIITGGLSGIGEAIAALFAQKGAKIVIFDIKDETEQLVSEKFKENGLGIKVDVTNKKNVIQAIATAKSHFGKIDMLVNSAGVALLDDAENLSEEYWDKTFAINVKGSFLVAQAVGNELISGNGGKIINMASQAAVVALDNHVAYCASKGAIVSMTKVLAYEWAQYDINVNCISPTVILTELGKKAWAGQVGEEMKKQIPAGRFGYPEEVAACALFLAADASNLITGENLVIDGGYTIK